MGKWQIDSWKKYALYQQPIWPDKKAYMKNIQQLKKLPSLVFSAETRNLIDEISLVNQDKAFILQVGDCAERFDDCNGSKIHNTLRIILQMAFILGYKSNKKIIKIGRIAGQYAKPRSSNFEIVDGVEMPSFRGDIVNGFTPSKIAREPNPNRLIEGYFRSAATLNLIRAFIQGGYSNIENLDNWKQHFFSDDISNSLEYKELEEYLSYRLKTNGNASLQMNTNDFYISHECLLLDYEEAFTRIDTTYKGFYDTSAHFLWIGERTRLFDSAHIEFVSGIGNPIGIKIGPNYDLTDIIAVIKRVNPENLSGKIVLVIRMGRNGISKMLKPLIKEIQNNGFNVTFISDPMHGNTYLHGGYKVRSIKDIKAEISSFINICHDEKVIPGGLHLELTSDNVTECIGGLQGIVETNVGDCYLAKVDPRLNAAQAIEIAFYTGKKLSMDQ